MKLAEVLLGGKNIGCALRNIGCGLRSPFMIIKTTHDKNLSCITALERINIHLLYMAKKYYTYATLKLIKNE